MSLKYRIGQRFGNLQLFEYLGTTPSNGAHNYIAKCACGKSERVTSHELVSGLKNACNKCAPSVKAESPREWLVKEQARQTAEADRKHQEESARIAEQQHRAAIQKELTRQRRLQDFMNDEGEFSPEAKAGWVRVRGYHEIYKKEER